LLQGLVVIMKSTSPNHQRKTQLQKRMKQFKYKFT